MIVLEALQWATNTLKTAFADEAEASPMLDAELLLGHAVGTNKAWVLSHLNHKLRTSEWQTYRRLVKQREQHVPIAYIVGEKEFYKRPFFVNQFTLIPRPSTETLIEEALATIKHAPDSTLIADIGTGSGAIAVTLAAETGLPVIATDIDKQALTVAKKNSEHHNTQDLIDFRQGNLLTPLSLLFKKIRQSQAQPYEHLLICSNLPYVPTTREASTQQDLKHEPGHAIYSGIDGLDAYWSFWKQLKEVRSLLPNHLTVMIEYDPSQTHSLTQLVQKVFPEAGMKTKKDLEEHDRVITITDI